MPGFDRTGPDGQGSKTGRRLGKCNPDNQESDEQVAEKDYPKGKNRKLTRGLGLGRNRGGGFRRGR